MKRFLKFAGDFLRSAPQIFLFELLFKLILTALGAPFVSFLLKIAMEHTGVAYISVETLPKLLFSPVTLAAVILMLFITAFFSIVELSSLISGFSCRFEGRKITVSGMLRSGLRAFAKAFRGSGILSFLGFMLIVPLAQFTLTSGVFSAPLMPMLRSLFGSAAKYAHISAFIIIQAAIAYLLASRSYCLHYLVLTKSAFSECAGKSRRCLEGKKLRTALTLILWSLLMMASAAAVTFIISFLIIFCIKGFSRPEAALVSALRVLGYTGKLFYAISYIISAPFIIGCLTHKFFYDTRQEECYVFPDSNVRKYPKPLKFSVMAVLAAAAVFLNFSYIQAIYKGNTSFAASIFSRPKITAHRGFSYAAPENTGYAFEAAVEIGADYIELDVQQTKDGQIVVFHDNELNRTTDGKGLVSDYTYEELQQFSCGSWFKKGDTDFSDARIMLLSDVIDLVGDDIMLNIEIKKHGNAEDTAVKTAELLTEHDMADSCYVTSFSYQALKAVKKTEPSIKTGLISNIAAAPMYNQLKYIDAVSLNYIFVTKNVVSAAHMSGKRVLVWTVNDRRDMEEMISIGVDSIITDRPDIAAETVYSYGKGDFVISLLKQIFGA